MNDHIRLQYSGTHEAKNYPDAKRKDLLMFAYACRLDNVQFVSKGGHMTRIGLSALLVISFLPTAAWPQGGNSTVRGSVRDQAQAVIPAATITLTNTSTNVARTTTSNDSGIYVFPGVIPGPYRLVVDFAGMQKFEGQLTVQTAAEVSVDVVLQVSTAA